MSAVSHGFSIADFEHLTIGLVMDCLTETIPDGERVYKATKEDYRKYL